MPSVIEVLAPFGTALSFAVPLMVALLLLQILLGAVRRKRRASTGRGGKARAPSPESRMERAVDQVHAVEASGFERTPLLNREEARLLPVLERAARDLGQGFRVMAQTSLGEVIRPTDRNDWEAHAAINAKRLDFAIFDRWGLIVCALEYQGSGHYQDGAVLRDAVKREALRKAGVRMIEVRPDFEEARLAQEIRAAFGARLAG